MEANAGAFIPRLKSWVFPRDYHNKANEVILETTWHRIVGFEKTQGIDVETLSRGDKVEVQGRIRNQRYTGEDGIGRTMSEVLASRIVRFDTEEPLQYEV